MAATAKGIVVTVEVGTREHAGMALRVYVDAPAADRHRRLAAAGSGGTGRANRLASCPCSGCLPSCSSALASVLHRAEREQRGGRLAGSPLVSSALLVHTTTAHTPAATTTAGHHLPSRSHEGLQNASSRPLHWNIVPLRRQSARCIWGRLLLAAPRAVADTARAGTLPGVTRLLWSASVQVCIGWVVAVLRLQHRGVVFIPLILRLRIHLQYTVVCVSVSYAQFSIIINTHPAY